MLARAAAAPRPRARPGAARRHAALGRAAGRERRDVGRLRLRRGRDRRGARGGEEGAQGLSACPLSASRTTVPAPRIADRAPRIDYRFTSAADPFAVAAFSNIPGSAISFSIASISIGTNADRFS